ncbi:cysteine proteinase, partial [Artomyces pyxidatus]
SSSKPTAPTSSLPVKSATLFSGSLDTSWPSGASTGSGLTNTGNTCFLNSALQCLLHTPPLVNVLLSHGRKLPCQVKNGFCMSCSMREVMTEMYAGRKHSINPYQVTSRLQVIAKHMRRGRQEDSHEFLRYAIDALQKSCLAGHSPKIDPKLAETTWVHQIFGGKLRSRVTCSECHHPSDTFDNILDLSIDIQHAGSVKEALRKFTTVDYLKGADKYKCEKCTRRVIAEKQFTVHEAPLILTVHLKRFSPMGRKIGHPIRYDEHLTLANVMSDGQYGPSYSLYGVISHAGGGPNSGHYFAHVKTAHGQWYEMNDDSVTRHHGVPTSMKNAYILFYMRNKGQALHAALASKPVSIPIVTPRGGVVAGMKKRKVVASDDEGDGGKSEQRKQPFIGPILPVAGPSTPVPSTPKPDPQAESLKRKIAAASKPSHAKPASALLSLVQYDDDDDDDDGDDDDVGEKVASPSGPETSATAATQETAPPTSPPASSPISPVSAAVPPSRFYGSNSVENAKKRKSPDGDDEVLQRTPGSRRQDITPGFSGKRKSIGSPYDRATNKQPLVGYGSRRNRPPRAV